MTTKSLKERATGRTTHIILQCVKDALNNPGVNIACYDHEPSTEANNQIALTCSQILGVLGFMHLREDNVICVKPYDRTN